MAPVIRNHQGYIDQYQGDAIMAIFPFKAEDAVLAAIEMKRVLSSFNKAQLENNDIPINMGIGISTGQAMLGVIGEKERQVSGMISDVANTASRVEGLNKMYGSSIILTGDTAAALSKTTPLKLRYLDQVILKGKKKTTKIYEVIEWENKIINISFQKYLELSNDSLHYYFKGDFAKAQAGFKVCLEYFPEDMFAKLILTRCENYLRIGTPSNWEGVTLITEK